MRQILISPKAAVLILYMIAIPALSIEPTTENQRPLQEVLDKAALLTSQNSVVPPDSAYLDSLIQDRMALNNVPGLSACVILNDQIVWQGAFGYANLEDSIEVTDTTLFQIASISKPFTSTALMQLYEDGLFDLDDDINDYLPFQVINSWRPSAVITFRTILAHASTISDRWGILLSVVESGSDSPIQLGDFMEQYLVSGGTYYSTVNYLDKDPGTYYAYSNAAYALAGHLVEVISGDSLEQYCQQNIFDTLGMTETSWFLSNLDTNNIAIPYGYDGVNHFRYSYMGMPWYPPAQLKTSPLQLAKFLISIMQKGQNDTLNILDSTTIELMTTVQYPGITYGSGPNVDHGLGLFEQDIHGRTVWGHGGIWDGVATLMSFSLVENIGAIVFVNLGFSTLNEQRTVMFGFANDMFNFAASFDSDSDSVHDGVDNCPNIFNPDQADFDGDLIGDACDDCTDTDGDNFGDPGFAANTCAEDNCPNVPNPDQTDSGGTPAGDACCCVGTVGNVDGEGGVDIADLTFLIDHLFINFPTLPCPNEGNVDNDGGTDIADLTFLIDHLFINFPILPDCP